MVIRKLSQRYQDHLAIKSERPSWPTPFPSGQETGIHAFECPPSREGLTSQGNLGFCQNRGIGLHCDNMECIQRIRL